MEEDKAVHALSIGCMPLQNASYIFVFEKKEDYSIVIFPKENKEA